MRAASYTGVDKGGAARWMIVGLGFATLAFAFTVRGSLSLAMPFWQAEFGWSRGAISSIAACAMIVMALVAPFAGGVADRQGPRMLLAGGLLAIAIGLELVMAASPGASGWLLPLGFAGVAAVGFGAIAQHVVAAAIAQRFDRNRGLATGIGTAGSTGGQLLMMPLIAAMMQGGDWRSAFLVLTVGCILLIPVSLLLLGGSPAESNSKQYDVAEGAHSDTLAANLKTLLRSPVFHAVFWSYTICGFTTSGVIETHLMPYAAYCGFGPLPSATAYGVLSGVNLGGMILAGWLADRTHRPLLLTVIYTVRAASFILLIYIGDDYAALLVFAVIFGLFDYSTVPITASYIASRMGVRIVGLSMGLLSAGHALGGAAGAWAGGILFDATGNYMIVWLASMVVAAIAAALVAGLKDDRAIKGFRRPDPHLSERTFP
ncbi:MFS transporter [Sinorhizobium mexicanum]|uniref:MFS transporter n=1 Tax=Sinorhizobium mexicanum TaxID=375549 RepID=A0A859QJY5_9HYPH|nr:MFS transporter [Sinorhizobium mexicanum]MBP1881874.1 MFS family permease [Sinorhizobium mexicanum]QLL61617.1 MFS transporter [Sinorhizobium mexicanum]